MSHDKGTNVSRETSRGAGEGEGFAKAGGTPRMPPQPRHPSHRPTTFLPPPRRPLSRNRPHRRSAAWTTPEHPAIAPATSRQRPHNTSPLPRPRSASPAPLGPTAPRPPPRGRAAPRRRHPAARTRGISSAAPPQRAAPRQQQPRGLAVPRRHPRPHSTPPPHGRTTLRQRRPRSAIRVTTPRQQRPRRRAHRASRRCSTSRRPPRTRWSQPHLGGLAMVTRSLLGGGPLGLGGLVARRHLLK